MSLDTNDGGIKATAYDALVMTAHLLREAVISGKQIEARFTGGKRQLEPVVGPDGRKYRRSEADGTFDIHIRIMPPAADVAPEGKTRVKGTSAEVESYGWCEPQAEDEPLVVEEKTVIGIMGLRYDPADPPPGLQRPALPPSVPAAGDH
jgi:hypothetical protein